MPAGRGRSSSRSRSRSRERDVHIPPANTNSSDPKLLNARIFIGNLATDKVTRSELVNIFGKYGRVLGISILRGYGFIQYESEEEGRAAVASESGIMLKGQRIDVKMAAEGRKKGGPGVGRGDRRGSPPPRGRPGRDRSPIRGGRDPYADDPYADDGPRGGPRGPPRGADPYARGDPFAPPGRFPPPREPPYGGDPYVRGDPLLRGDPYAPPAAPPAVAAARRPPPAPMVADCEIITFSPKQRSYADAIERRLRAVGVVSHQLPLSSPDSLPKALEDITRRGLLFAISLNEQNEQHRSLTLNILHGTPQEHRNMPYEDAITLVQRNYEEYRKKKAEAAAALTSQQTDFLKPDSKQAYLLNLLADNRFLTLDELDAVISYLSLRRDHALKKEAGKAVVPGAAILSEESAIVQQQQALQARILNILGGSSSSKTGSTATAPVQAGVPPAPQAAVHQTAAKAATNINFDNPSVQQALNNLISTGGIKTVQSPPVVAAPSAPGYEQAYYQQQQQQHQQYAAQYGQQQPVNGAPAAAAAAQANYSAAVAGYPYQQY